MESLEDISDENLVWFCRKELERLDDGVSTTILIPIKARRRLIQLGILEYGRGRGGIILSTIGGETLDSYKCLALSVEWDKEG